MSAEALVSRGHGVVVLAAFEPDAELFRIQLESIRDQTRGDFRCLIGADGGQERIRELVDEFVGDDARFEVIGWDDNVGFYLNFERLLMAVPADAAWVALSDQDDRWYPDKLEKLLPLLDDFMLATGQARVVNDHVADQCTRREVLPAKDLLLQNQVTGALTVFRVKLLMLALPFPRRPGITEFHDHWLAMCAATSCGYQVLDDVVQDYVQHADNVVGEESTWATHSRRSFTRLVTSASTQESGQGSLRRFATPPSVGVPPSSRRFRAGVGICGTWVFLSRGSTRPDPGVRPRPSRCVRYAAAR